MMNKTITWEAPNRNIFWIAVPYNPYQRLDSIIGQVLDVIHPKTGEKTQTEILDFLGAYPMKNLPNHLARDCTDQKFVDGEFLARHLKDKKPEFKYIQKVLFYQLAKIKNE